MTAVDDLDVVPRDIVLAESVFEPRPGHLDLSVGNRLDVIRGSVAR
jgi:hypothetical protein